MKGNRYDSLPRWIWRARQMVLLITAISITVILSPESGAAIITQNTGGSSSGAYVPGNSLTTPSGGPWNNITFSWFLDSGTAFPNAFGTLFLLSQEYLGTPSALSGTTQGFLAQSQTISAGAYIFASGVTLQPNTKYFLYANAVGSQTSGADVSGENGYSAGGTTSDFQSSSIDQNYRLSGEVVPVPEPSAGLWAVLGMVAFAAGATVNQHRTKRKAAAI